MVGKCMKEEWRTIKDYPNYSVSNLGRVRNSKTGRILKSSKCGGGAEAGKYLHVILYQGSRASRKSIGIHRLVAKAFIPNPDNKPEVNHIDGNGYNNVVSNLEWVTHTENMIHAFSILHPKIYIPKKVIRVEDGCIFDSIDDAAYACGFADHISFFTDYLDGKKQRQTIGGYHWKYLEQ